MSPQSAWRPLPLRAALFVALFGVLQLAWELARGGGFERFVIHDATVQPAAALVRWLTPDVRATAVDFSIKAPGGGLNVLNGCEGTEALFLLLAAFVAAPLGWRTRLAGLLTGAAVVFVVNQVRIVILFYAWRADPARFSLLHGLVLPIAVVLLVSGYFYGWLVFASRPAAPAT